MSERPNIDLDSPLMREAAIRHAEDDGVGGIDSSAYATESCPRCHGTGYFTVEHDDRISKSVLCPCVLEGRRRHACELRILNRFGAGGAKMTLGAYQPGNSEMNRAALEGCKAYVQNFPAFAKEGVGFALVGQPGCGKTHLATGTLIALVKRWPDRHGGLLTPFHLSVPEMLNLKRKSFKDDTVNDVIDQAMIADVTLLDDLGAEYRRDDGDGMGWVDEQLYMILNHRLTRNLPTLYTTNLSKTRLAQMLNERISRRLDTKTAATWPVEPNPDVSHKQTADELKRLLVPQKPRTLKDAWDDGMNALRAYGREHGDFNVPDGHMQGTFALGAFLAAVRTAHHAGKLTDAQTEQMSKVPGWSWNTSD